MFYHVMAVFLLGLFAALAVFTVRRTFKGRVPTWIYPAAIGFVMIGFSIWSEYSWFWRTKTALPASIQIVDTYTTSVFYQPWTYLIPRVNRFTAVDVGSRSENPNAPGYAMTSVLLVERFGPTRTVPHIFDCNAKRAAGIPPNPKFDDNGLPADAKWIDSEQFQPIIAAACEAKLPD